VSGASAKKMVQRLRDTVVRSLGALLVARQAESGYHRCAQLSTIVAGWDGDFTVLLRKRISRHIEFCPNCAADPDFDLWWTARGVAHKAIGRKRIYHPGIGTVRVDWQVLDVPKDPDQCIVVMPAADHVSAVALSALTQRRGLPTATEEMADHLPHSGDPTTPGNETGMRGRRDTRTKS
jgi:hypothetical protein